MAKRGTLNSKFLARQRKWPAFWQWKRFFKILGEREKVLFLLFFFAFLACAFFLGFSFYFKNTKIAPAQGGVFVEGILNQAQPRFITPIYANSDIDRDLTELMFSGLMKYSSDMKIIPDLARDYPEVEDEGKTYKFYLKENIFWQDGTPITADDVVFTIKTIQNSEFKSPYLANWVGVKVEKVNDITVKFALQKPYSGFLENCTVKILPKHIWEEISASSFALDPHNLEQAIGSGKYRMKEVKRNDSGAIQYLVLEKNNLYYGKKPYLNEVKFVFFEKPEDLIKNAQKEKISGLNSTAKQTIKNWQENNLTMPRYFAVFFNQEKSKALKIKEVRQALSYATNKKEISEKIVQSPILPEFYGFDNSGTIYEFDLEKAKQILDQAGFKDQNGDNVREKTVKKQQAFTFKSQLTLGSKGTEVQELQKCLQGEVTGSFGEKTKQLVIDFQEKYAEDILKPAGLKKGNGVVGPSTRKKLNEICFGNPEETIELRFSLVTVDQEELIKTAQILKEQWQKIGIEAQIQSYPLFELEQDYIKPRAYDALLFGEVLGATPDPFPFWHSSQAADPGLNLSLYQNKNADALLEENRKSSQEQERRQKLQEFQDIIAQDIPAIFLYSPDYYFYTSPNVKGVTSKKLVDPSKRFIDIEEWYIKTKRVF